MGAVRSRLHLIAVVSIVIQMAVLASAVTVVCCSNPTAPAAHSANGDCDMKGAHICPMHKTASRHAADAAVVRAACVPPDAVLQTFLGVDAILTGTIPMVGAPIAVLDRLPADGAAEQWTAIAASPPPKA
jgi:hypothetical protein